MTAPDSDASPRPPVRIPPPPAGWSEDRGTALTPPPARRDGTRVWLARHALVHEDYQDRAYGGQDVPLSSHGLSQTAELCAAFEGARLARVRSSDLERAQRLGHCIAERTGAALVLDPRLREIDRGHWQGLPKKEFAARWHAQNEEWYADPRTWRPDGGECDEEVEGRVLPAFEAAASEAEEAGEATLLACHYNVIRVLQTRLLGRTPLEGWALPIDLARATLLEAEGGRWHVIAANVVTLDRTDVRPSERSS